MKKAILVGAMAMSLTAIAGPPGLGKAMASDTAFDYQKVYKVDQSAENIRTAAGQLVQNVYCKFWGVTLPFHGDINLEAKDGRYRISFIEMTSSDTGSLLSNLPDGTKESCNEAMVKYSDKVYKKISNWSDF